VPYLSFRADAVVPAQFYPARPGSASVEPIMRLMAGILIDAVRCFQNNFEARHPSRRQEFNLLAPRFSPSQRAWVLAGKLVKVDPSVPASAGRAETTASLRFDWERQDRPGICIETACASTWPKSFNVYRETYHMIADTVQTDAQDCGRSAWTLSAGASENRALRTWGFGAEGLGDQVAPLLKRR
jgi:hypothetical protein